MAAPRILFYDTKPYDRTFFDEANKRYHYTIHYVPYHLTADTVVGDKGFDVVCIFINDYVTAEIADALVAANIRLLALRSAGYNNIDLSSLHKRLHVVRVPAYSPHAIAEHAVALMLTLNRKTHRAYFRTREGNFSLTGLMGFDMCGKTAGVIGTGKIGKAAAGILKGFGMRVLTYDVYPDSSFAKNAGCEYVDLDTLYRESDIITLHCPLTPDTMYMITGASIAKMKSGVMIINTGRGKLIDTTALIKGLKNKKIGAAGLDVYEEEGDYFFEDLSSEAIGDDILARLLTFPNVLITSHQAFFTTEAIGAIASTTLENVRLFFEENKLPNEICYRCS